jgi:hypothetical protein
MHEKLNKISGEDRDALEEFLDNLTEGDVIKIAREMLYDRQDIKKFTKALENFQNA